MLSVFGEIGRSEEFFSKVVYPVWPLWLIGAIISLAAVSFLAYRRGWLRNAAAHPLLTSVTAVVIIAAAIYPSYYAISPLFERSTLCEASPIPGVGSGSGKCASLAIAATMPPTVSPTKAPTAAPTDAPAATPFTPYTVRAGRWESADDFHYTIGDALIIETGPSKYTLRFENFSVRNGPDVFVLLSKTNDHSGETLNLGGLRGTDGAFNYDVPAGTDVSQYKSVIIWCRQFDVLFGHAELT